MIDFARLVQAWGEHLKKNAETDLWSGDLGWRAFYAEWQAFCQDWEETRGNV